MLEKGIAELVQQANQTRSEGRPDIEQRRQGYLDSCVLAGEKMPISEIVDTQLEGYKLRVYRPSADDNLPVLIYFHGGCFVSGGFETHDQQLRYIAHRAQALVIAVAYRLAPEHRFPAAHDDAYFATLAIQRECATWGGDVNNISLAGDSAGGHLCLSTCVRLKREHGILPRQQILIYPMLDATASSKSYVEFGDDYVITKDMLLSGFEMYLEGTGVQTTDPRVSPLFCNDLLGLPATHILTAEFDPLVDEGERLYRKLRDAGVDAYCRRYLGVIHGFIQLGGICRSAHIALDDIAALLTNL